MVDAKPWGLAPELRLLEPAKVVTDPVHGDIYLNRLELLVVNSRPLQRLRRVRQLGMTPQVYPGATNTRFAHSLGTLRVAQDLLDVVLDQRHDPHAVADLFGAWAMTADHAEDSTRSLGEVVVAARVGALLHDIAHVPFGHSIEDDLGILPAHDKGPERFEFLWQQMAADLKERTTEPEFADLATLVDGELATELRPMILSKEIDAAGEQIDAHHLMRYPFIADLVGNTICADLPDYLPRDHLYSGLPLALGHRFLSAFFVTGTDRTRLACRMALNIVRENRERTDIITELLKYLRYRYELTERILVHHGKLAADAMVGKALELWFDEIHDEIAAEITTEGGKGEDDDQGRDGTKLGPLDEARGDDARTRTRKRIERRVLLHGDDGLLEHLCDWAEQRQVASPPTSDPARRVPSRLRPLDRAALGHGARLSRARYWVATHFQAAPSSPRPPTSQRAWQGRSAIQARRTCTGENYATYSSPANSEREACDVHVLVSP